MIEESMGGYDPQEIIWRGRQWAVTTYGMETLGEPYHYHFEAERLGERMLAEEDILDWPFHLAEKDWLDVDDFMTAFLVALAVHRGAYEAADGATVIRSLQAGIERRQDLFGHDPALIQQPKSDGLYSMEELGKYQPHPIWRGSEMLGPVVTGEVSDRASPDEED